MVANGDFYGVFIPLHFSLTLSIDIHDFRESFRDVLKKRQKLNLYFHEFFVFLIPVKNVDPNDSFCPENIFFGNPDFLNFIYVMSLYGSSLKVGNRSCDPQWFPK